jgi:hypothetical protein
MGALVPDRRPLVLLLTLMAVLAPSPVRAQSDAAALAAVTAPVMSQLDAFRRGDFEAAYGYASEEIREQFDREAFERMVRSGYPEIARSASAQVAEARQVGDGHVHLLLRIQGANGRSIEAVYDMVREPAGWRINGVATRPGGPAA